MSANPFFFWFSNRIQSHILVVSCLISIMDVSFLVRFARTYAPGTKVLWTIWLTSSLMASLSLGLMTVNSMFIS